MPAVLATHMLWIGGVWVLVCMRCCVDRYGTSRLFTKSSPVVLEFSVLASLNVCSGSFFLLLRNLLSWLREITATQIKHRLVFMSFHILTTRCCQNGGVYSTGVEML